MNEDLIALNVESILRPNDGWYNRETGRTIRQMAHKLIMHNFTQAETVELLEDVIAAVEGEFGE